MQEPLLQKEIMPRVMNDTAEKWGMGRVIMVVSFCALLVATGMRIECPNKRKAMIQNGSLFPVEASQSA